MFSLTQRRELGRKHVESNRDKAQLLKSYEQDIVNAIIAENAPLARSLLTDIVQFGHPMTAQPSKRDLANARRHAGSFAFQRVEYAMHRLAELMHERTPVNNAVAECVAEVLEVPEFNDSDDEGNPMIEWPFYRASFHAVDREAMELSEHEDEPDYRSDDDSAPGNAEPPLQRRRVEH